MTAQELRIGNLVKFGDNLCVVRAIFLTHFRCVNVETGIDYGESIRVNYEPIPLTEDLILNSSAGFEKISDDGIPTYETDYDCPKPDGVYGHRILFRIMKHDFGYWFILEYQDTKRGINLGTFYYFHQLQNIWQDLTGNELTFKK
jgi:hypothetical protein